MVNIIIAVNGNKIKIDHRYLIVEGQLGACELEFHFTEEWDDLTKIVFIKYQDNIDPIEITLDDTNKCNMPDEAMAQECRIIVGIRGTNLEGNIRVPTVYAMAADVVKGVPII